VKARNEIIKMLMATVSESRLYDHFDVRIVVEGFADQLVLINDEHHRQIAQAKATFDAEIDVLKRQLAFVNSNFDGALERFFLGLQGALFQSSEVINHAEFATTLMHAKEEFDREIATLRHELVQANQEPAMLRAIDAFNGSGRGPNDVLN
jgi:hypothetical protein